MAFYIVAAEEQGAKLEQLAGTIQNDILKEYMVRNTYIYPPDSLDADHRRHLRLHLAEDAEVQLHLHLRLPHAGSRRHGRPRTGLHPGRRLEYVRTGLDKAGIDIDAFAPRLSFFWAEGMNYFMEVAKMRAARVLWAKIVKQFNPRTRSRWPCAPTRRPRAGA
jgi:methylmalonyl-CoA mutase